MAQMPWEMDYTSNGQPIPAGGGLGRPIIQRNPQPSPRNADQMIKDRAEAAAASAKAPYAGRVARADLIKSEADAATSQRNAVKAQAEANTAIGVLTPKQIQAGRSDAWEKIKLIRNIRERIKRKDGYMGVDLIPETGLLGKIASQVGGTRASGIAADLETIRGGGIIAKITDMMAATGGKNPFSPMSNVEGQLVGTSIGNLDLNQPKDTLLSSLDRYERAYTDALRTVGYKLKEPPKQKSPPMKGDIDSILAKYGVR